MNVQTKPFAWSFSALDQFETCARKYYETKITKKFSDPAGPEGKWGLDVHKAMADRIEKGRALPEGMQQFERWIDWAMINSNRTEVVTKVEHKLAITANMQPCEYFDRSVPVWYRTVADVLKVRLPHMRIIDWKTGKFKPDTDQLLLTAACAFVHFPQVEQALCQFVWLKNDVPTELRGPEGLPVSEMMFTRKDLPFLWQRMLPRVAEMQQAYLTSEYKPNPSGLCKRHCTVTTCQYHGKGRY